MKLSDYDLRQMDDVWVEALPADRLRLALRQTLNDLKEARDRLNMMPENSFRPPGSMTLWDKSTPMPESPYKGLEPAADKCTKADPKDKYKYKDNPPDSADGPATISPKHVSGKLPDKPLGTQGLGRTQQLPSMTLARTCLHSAPPAPWHCH